MGTTMITAELEFAINEVCVLLETEVAMKLVYDERDDKESRLAIQRLRKLVVKERYSSIPCLMTKNY